MKDCMCRRGVQKRRFHTTANIMSKENIIPHTTGALHALRSSIGDFVNTPRCGFTCLYGQQPEGKLPRLLSGFKQVLVHYLRVLFVNCKVSACDNYKVVKR